MTSFAAFLITACIVAFFAALIICGALIIVAICGGILSVPAALVYNIRQARDD